MVQPEKDSPRLQKNDENTQPGNAPAARNFFYAERLWPALIIASTAAVLLLSVYCLSHGITIIFMHLYYFPIVLMCYRYRYRGLVPVTFLSLAYVVLVYVLTAGQPDLIAEAWYRFLLFVAIAAVVAYLSERLAAGREALQESEAKYHAFFSTSMDCVFFTTPEGKWVDFNDAAVGFFGYGSRDELLAVGIRDLYADPSARKEHIRAILEKGYVREYPVDLKKKDGSVIHTLITTMPRRNAQEKIIGFQGTIRDITERQQAAEHRDQQFRFLQQLLDTIPNPVFYKDANGIYTGCNHAFEEYVGLRLDQIIGRSVYEIAPKDLADTYSASDKMLFDNPGSQRYEARVRYADGSLHNVVFYKATFSDMRGTVLGLVGIILDITERKLREDEIRLQIQIAETITEGVYIIRSSDGTIVSTNEKFDQMFGYEKGELIGRHVSLVNAPEAKRSPGDTARTIMGVLRETGRWRGEVKNLRKDGTEFWSLAVVSTFEHPAFGSVWISAHTDITARKLAEEAVQAAVTLNEQIDTLSISECMTVTLDVAERLTASRIGFFHFVNDDEKTIRLMVWSTETKKHCFNPREPESNYPVEKGGVWLGALRERRPVIHNDYASLPDRKSLPPGHVPVLRELVVPVFDAGKIVAIIGVGNKVGEYDHKDIDILTLLAKNAWTLIRRKRAEESLRESGKQYRDLVENLNEVIVSIDREGKLTYVSPVAERLYGYPPADLTGQHFLQFIHPDDRDRVTNVFRKELSGIYQADEFRVIAQDRSIHWISVAPRPIERHGDVVGFNYMMADITNRKQAEETLRESEQKFRDIFNNSTDAIHINEIRDDGMPGRFTDINEVTCRMLGYTREEILAMGPQDIAIPYHDPPVEKILEDQRTKGEARFETGYRSKDGRVIPVEIVTHRMILQGRQVMLEVVRDLTERRKAESALRANQFLLEEALDQGMMAYWELDVPSGIFTFNDRLYALYGTDTAREGGYRMTAETYSKKFVHPGDAASVGLEIQKAIDTTDPQFYSEVEHRIIRGDGKERYILVRYRITKDAEGRTIKTHGVNQDITERKKAEELISHFNRELEAQVKAQTEKINASLNEKVILLREIHHRVKNNLQLIISLTNLQMRQSTDEQLIQVMKETQNRVRAMSLVHERLYHSEDIARINLADYTRFLATQIFGFYGVSNREVKLNFDIGKIMLDINTAIPTGLIINELVSNALKHAFPDNMAGELSISAHEEGHMIVLHVRDTGIGMPPGFDWKESQSLGLRLVRILVEQLNGSIELLPGEKGTAFFIRLNKAKGTDSTGM